LKVRPNLHADTPLSDDRQRKEHDYDAAFADLNEYAGSYIVHIECSKARYDTNLFIYGMRI
jgi:hypothetical protein